MADNQLYTITDLIKAIPEIADLSNQRVSAIVRQLKDEGAVERIEEKRKAYFRKVSE
jgi:DNA-binding transcriptional regulator GbsR (MarR family)